MLKSDFFYHIPDELVAQEPALQREKSRLLICNGETRTITDEYFYNLPKIILNYFIKNDKKVLFVLNDSRVYPARVRIVRKTGARGEVFLLETGEKKTYKCLLRPKNKLKLGEVLYTDLDDKIPLFRIENLENPEVSIIPPNSVIQILDQYGEMPLPPYIDRDPKRVSNKKNMDQERYQTVYSDKNKLGSAAAPTAGLHFTENIISECQKLGAEFTSVTLHVGLGTFSPVESTYLQDHGMHEEHYCVSSSTLSKICEYLANNNIIIFIGTTSLRTIESFFRNIFVGKQQNELRELAQNGELYIKMLPYANNWLSTKLFLYPEKKEQKIKPLVGNAIITNFHQPESTLAMLVASIMAYDFWKEFYSHAIEQKYRFFSYGDSSLLIF